METVRINARSRSAVAASTAAATAANASAAASVSNLSIGVKTRSSSSLSFCEHFYGNSTTQNNLYENLVNFIISSFPSTEMFIFSHCNRNHNHIVLLVLSFFVGFLSLKL